MQQALQQPQTLCIKHLAKTIVSVGLSKMSLLVCKSGQIVGLLGPNGAGKPPVSIWWLD